MATDRKQRERQREQIHIKIKAVQIFYFLLILLIIFIMETNHAYAQCNRRGIVTQNTDMWDRPPQLITGKGWVYGNKVGTLPVNISIYICQVITVGFGYSTQHWYQIAYWNNQWWYAWVFADHIRLNSNLLNPDQKEVFASIAMAQPPSSPLSTSLPQPLKLPEGIEPSIPTTEKPSEFQLLPSLNMLYLYLFFSMVIGMMVKTIVDIFESWGMVRVIEHLRKGVIPILVSPIVFLGFMETAKFNVSGQKGFIILLLLAFQNGFFWQTVFGRKVIVIGKENKSIKSSSIK